jgi:hypothetical protein
MKGRQNPAGAASVASGAVITAAVRPECPVTADILAVKMWLLN